MRRRDWWGEPALVCAQELCPRKMQLWFTMTKWGRAFLATWMVLAIVGVAALVAGCDPLDDTRRHDSNPTSVTPVPLLTHGSVR